MTEQSENNPNPFADEPAQRTLSEQKAALYELANKTLLEAQQSAATIRGLADSLVSIAFTPEETKKAMGDAQDLERAARELREMRIRLQMAELGSWLIAQSGK